MKIIAGTAFLLTIINAFSFKVIAGDSLENYGSVRAGLLNGYTLYRKPVVPVFTLTFTEDSVTTVLARKSGESCSCFQEIASIVKSLLGDRTEQLVGQISSKVLEMFAGEDNEERMPIFLYALRATGPLKLKTAALNDEGINRAAEGLFKLLKPAAARFMALEEARKAGISSIQAPAIFAREIIDLYRNGVLVDKAINVAEIEQDPVNGYPLVLESLQRLGNYHTQLNSELIALKKYGRRSSSLVSLEL